MLSINETNRESGKSKFGMLWAEMTFPFDEVLLGESKRATRPISPLLSGAVGPDEPTSALAFRQLSPDFDCTGVEKVGKDATVADGTPDLNIDPRDLRAPEFDKFDGPDVSLNSDPNDPKTADWVIAEPNIPDDAEAELGATATGGI
jgi:hypothetical protein